MRQWMLRITAYAERLLADLEKVDYPESIVAMQRDRIGRCEGADVDVCDRRLRRGRSKCSRRAPTRCSAPPFASWHLSTRWSPRSPCRSERQRSMRTCAEVASKSDLERIGLRRGKTGVFTGACAINPVNGEQIPIWVADYVLVALRHRRDHVRARSRQPRLGVRAGRSGCRSWR